MQVGDKVYFINIRIFIDGSKSKVKKGDHKILGISKHLIVLDDEWFTYLLHQDDSSNTDLPRLEAPRIKPYEHMLEYTLFSKAEIDPENIKDRVNADIRTYFEVKNQKYMDIS